MHGSVRNCCVKDEKISSKHVVSGFLWNLNSLLSWARPATDINAAMNIMFMPEIIRTISIPRECKWLRNP